MLKLPVIAGWLRLLEGYLDDAIADYSHAIELDPQGSVS
jgi:hypothetical protein